MTEFKASSKKPQQKQEQEVEPEDEAEQQDFAAIVRGRKRNRLKLLNKKKSDDYFGKSKSSCQG
jgi:hypothetical protein